MQVGFIGLGNLGEPIAVNLLEHHKGMLVYNRTEAKAKPLEAKGAKVCKTVKELAAQCDVVFSIVSNDTAVKEITEGEDGIAANLKENGVHVSISTISPATSEALYALHQQHKNHYVASPVAGRPEAAVAKKLNFMVSGESSSVEKIKPLLNDAGAVNIWEYGTQAGNANVAKLCTNYMIQASLQSMSEAIYLAQKSGVDEKQIMNMLTSTLFSSPIFINYSKLVLEEKFQPAAFSLELGLKDATLIKAQAESVNAKMPLGKLIHEEYTELKDNGYGDYDWAALALSVK